ncbi:DUF2357 domain-containing protein [Sorangium sp. So ce385]|uniref:DUF2357 domain-containing protein n=1 Tax=Sorangium sp. So ce385 TaxID=3133308 RepID=UPI003F5B2B4A
MIQIYDAGSGDPVHQDATGAFVVHDQRTYLLRSEEPLGAGTRHLTIQPGSSGRVATLCFNNYVGLAQVAGLRFRVRHAKLTEPAFTAMLDGVVRDVADLAFDYGSPTTLPFERDLRSSSQDVLYHALAYLRHVMRRVDGEDQLAGHFLQIARHPHRRVEPEARWVPVERAAHIGPGGLLAVIGHPKRLGRLRPGSRLAETGLGRRLSRHQPVFPVSALVSDPTEGFDTHENRLVLHVLRLASDILDAFDGRDVVNPDLGHDVRAMREEIDWMLSFDFLREVGPIQIVPSQSSVLQRREGYREFLGHFVRLSLSSVLAGDRDRWHALLDLKNGALLYELWSFFEVKRALDALLGKPESADLAETDEKRRKVPWSARLRYRRGEVELVYNGSYRRGSGSYSVRLRPDVVVRARRPEGWKALILDAKLKFDGDRLDELEDDDPSGWDRSVTREDLYKMHTYRDAIREAVGAFVLYPGSRRATYPETADGRRWNGIGAVPLEPGRATGQLRALLEDFLDP